MRWERAWAREEVSFEQLKYKPRALRTPQEQSIACRTHQPEAVDAGAKQSLETQGMAPTRGGGGGGL